MRFKFDHLVVAAERLSEGVKWAEERLGCQMQAGGAHARYGTHNALLGLKDGLYLEVIAIDPEAEPEARPRWFDLDRFSGAPRLVTWVCSSEGLGQAALPSGFDKVVSLSRGDLRWKMAEARGGRLPFDQCFPGLIDWGETPHPANRLAQSGLALSRLEITHPEAERLEAALGEVSGAPVVFGEGEAHLSALLSRDDGTEVWL